MHGKNPELTPASESEVSPIIPDSLNRIELIRAICCATVTNAEGAALALEAIRYVLDYACEIPDQDGDEHCTYCGFLVDSLDGFDCDYAQCPLMAKSR